MRTFRTVNHKLLLVILIIEAIIVAILLFVRHHQPHATRPDSQRPFGSVLAPTSGSRLLLHANKVPNAVPA